MVNPESNPMSKMLEELLFKEVAQQHPVDKRLIFFAINEIPLTVPSNLHSQHLNVFVKSYSQDEVETLAVAILTMDKIIHDFEFKLSVKNVWNLKIGPNTFTTFSQFHRVDDEKSNFSESDPPYRAFLRITNQFEDTLRFEAEGNRKLVESLRTFAYACIRAQHESTSNSQ